MPLLHCEACQLCDAMETVGSAPTHPEYVVPKSTPTIILSDVTWMCELGSPSTTGVGAEKLTLGPAIGKGVLLRF